MTAAPITPTEPDLASVIAAARTRDERHAAAQEVYKSSVAEANSEFAGVVRRAKDDGSSITRIAEAVGLSRPQLHDILRRS